MSAQANAQPIIIKRKKKGGGDGHHGGAWKVAYADFVTAMMAFFMLMWLLNATSEQQRSGIADYFSPTIAIHKGSGGGDGAFGGDSVFAEETLPENGRGATAENPTESNAARGATGTEFQEETVDEMTEIFESMEEELLGKGGESSVMENLLEHIVTRVTDEGLVIELFSLEHAQLFVGRTAEPTQLLRDLTTLVAETSRVVTNKIAVGGHVQAQPIVVATENGWDVSMAQATTMRLLLEDAGMASSRIERVTGFADREPSLDNPMDIRNNRLEIVLLRE